MKKPGIKTILSNLTLIITFTWGVLYIKNHASEFKDIQTLSWYHFAIMIALFLAGLLLRGYFTKLIVDSLGIKLNFKQWFGLTAVNNLGNYIVPFGGFGLRAAYLKSIHGFPYTYFASLVMATYLFQFIGFSFLGIISLLFLYIDFKFFHLPLLCFFLIIILACIGFTFIYPKIPTSKRKIFSYFNKMFDGLEKLKEKPHLTFKLYLLLFLRAFVLVASFYFAFWAFDYPIHWAQALLVATLAVFIVLVSFTPASLGLQEGAIVLSSKLFGFSVANGLLVAGLIRISSLICVLSLGPIFSYLLMKETPTKNSTE